MTSYRAKAVQKPIGLVRIAPWSGAMHGGTLRSMQISEIVTKALPHITRVSVSHPRSEPLSHSLQALARIPKVFSHAILQADGLKSVAGAAWLNRALSQAGLPLGAPIIFDADLSYGSSLLAAARSRKSPVLALPHNLEAFTSNRWRQSNDPPKYLALLSNEINWLSGVESIWSIGEFDRAFLELFGFEAPILPYFPPRERHAELLSIRNQRSKSERRHILILGTAGNDPTREGILAQLNYLRDHGPPPGGLPVIVAGYRTELLAQHAPAHVDVIGSQSWDDIKKLLASAAVLWVHQGPMTGALTRITEALVAGTPVLANRWATIGLSPMPGLTRYDDIEAIPTLLSSLEESFPVPDISISEQCFSEKIIDLVSR